MRRIWSALGAALVALVAAPAAAALHYGGGQAGTTTGGGFPWETVLIWCGIGVGVALIALWAVAEGRRHHWRLPHRPVHT